MFHDSPCAVGVCVYVAVMENVVGVSSGGRLRLPSERRNGGPQWSLEAAESIDLSLSESEVSSSSESLSSLAIRAIGAGLAP